VSIEKPEEVLDGCHRIPGKKAAVHRAHKKGAQVDGVERGGGRPKGT